MDQNPEGQGQKSIVGNNQPNPTPAAPSGAIFSGSSAPTGTAPVGAPSQPTSGSSRPFFSHHPAHTFSREMGDIVVGGTPQPKKSKKPFIIAGAILLLFAVIAVVALIVASSTNSQTPVLRAFNEYANYFLYGQDSTQNIEGTYQYGDTYWLSDMNLSDEQIAEHFQAAEVKYQEFYDLYSQFTNSSPDNITEEVRTMIDDYYEQLDLLSYTIRFPNLGASELLEAYMEAPGEAEQLIKDYYSHFSDSSVQNTRDFATSYITAATSLINTYQVYDANGCISASTASIRRVCQQDTSNAQIVQANNQYKSFNDFYQTQSALTSDVQINVFQNIWLISRELQ